MQNRVDAIRLQRGLYGPGLGRPAGHRKWASINPISNTGFQTGTPHSGLCLAGIFPLVNNYERKKKYTTIVIRPYLLSSMMRFAKPSTSINYHLQRSPSLHGEPSSPIFLFHFFLQGPNKCAFPEHKALSWCGPTHQISHHTGSLSESRCDHQCSRRVVFKYLAAGPCSTDFFKQFQQN